MGSPTGCVQLRCPRAARSHQCGTCPGRPNQRSLAASSPCGPARTRNFQAAAFAPQMVLGGRWTLLGTATPARNPADRRSSDRERCPGRWTQLGPVPDLDGCTGNFSSAEAAACRMQTSLPASKTVVCPPEAIVHDGRRRLLLCPARRPRTLK